MFYSYVLVCDEWRPIGPATQRDGLPVLHSLSWAEVVWFEQRYDHGSGSTSGSLVLLGCFRLQWSYTSGSALASICTVSDTCSFHAMFVVEVDARLTLFLLVAKHEIQLVQPPRSRPVVIHHLLSY